MDVNYLPLTDMRIARTFCFTNGGQALYLSSPTEIQRITYSQEMCDNLQVSTAALHASVSVTSNVLYFFSWCFFCLGRHFYSFVQKTFIILYLCVWDLLDSMCCSFVNILALSLEMYWCRK